VFSLFQPGGHGVLALLEFPTEADRRREKESREQKVIVKRY